MEAACCSAGQWSVVTGWQLESRSELEQKSCLSLHVGPSSSSVLSVTASLPLKRPAQRSTECYTTQSATLLSLLQSAVRDICTPHLRLAIDPIPSEPRAPH